VGLVGNWNLRGNPSPRLYSHSVTVKGKRLQVQMQHRFYFSHDFPSYQWLPPVALCRVFQGWTQEISYLNRRGSRTKRGVRAYSPAWSEPPNRNPVARVGMRKRHHRVMERRTATGKPQGGNRRAHEGATYRKRWGSLSPVGFRPF